MSFFNVKDVATILSISEETVRRWIRRGELKADILGGRAGYRINPKELESFIVNYKGWTTLLGDKQDMYTHLQKQPEIDRSPALGKVSEMGLGEVMKTLLDQNQEDIKEMKVEIFQKKYELNQKKAVLIDQIRGLESKLLEVEEALGIIIDLEDELSEEK